ncbi:MAG: eL32 family ribosomal protein [Nanoarchaeota archaeon]|nr:eL32 family ribosomal protein [Nanoarchaeota archaeon]
MVKFLRRTWGRYSKLGKRRKKKQIWRRPTGRDNKMREKRKGYPSIVSIGYKKDKKLRGKIKGVQPILVKNIRDLDKTKKGDLILVGKVGKKKKIELLKKAKEMKLEIQNVNPVKFLKKNKEKKGEEVKEKKNESK